MSTRYFEDANLEKPLSIFLHPEENKVNEVIGDFIDFLKDDYANGGKTDDEDKERLAFALAVEKLVPEFLGYTMKDVEQAEKDKLQAWTDSANAYPIFRVN